MQIKGLESGNNYLGNVTVGSHVRNCPSPSGLTNEEPAFRFHVGPAGHHIGLSHSDDRPGELLLSQM